MKPVIVYLDTSDLIALRAAASSDEENSLYRKLIALKDAQLAIFPISFFHFFEYLQAADSKFISDRYDRANFLSNISGGWSFPYYEDLSDGSTVDLGPNWMPMESLKLFEIERLLNELRVCAAKNMREYGLGTRKERRKIKSLDGFRNFIKENPKALASVGDQSGDRLYGAFFESGILRKFALGAVQKEAANEILRREVLTFAAVYHWYFEQGKNDNPVTDRLRQLKVNLDGKFAELRDAILRARKISEELGEMERRFKNETELSVLNDERRKLLKRLKEQKSEAKRFISRPLGEPMIDILPNAIVAGEQFKFIASEVFNAVATEKVPFQSSLMGDLLHSIYMPFCDLWRGDRSFSNILISNKVPNHQKVISKLQDLPKAIEEVLAKRKAC